MTVARRSALPRVTLRIDGGFAHLPGLVGPIEVDAAGLDADRAAQMERLCVAACAVAPGSGARLAGTIPDARRYLLTVEVDGGRRQLTVADPVVEPAIAELIAFVEAHRRRDHPDSPV